MKRTNLVLDEATLEAARVASGLKTYSDVVNLALRELLRRKAFERIDNFASSGVWDGNLDGMRGDSGVSR